MMPPPLSLGGGAGAFLRACPVFQGVKKCKPARRPVPYRILTVINKHLIINIKKYWHGDCFSVIRQHHTLELLDIKMPAACEVLWLDPVEKLDNAVRARLGEAGLSVVVVNTLDELNAMLRHVHMVVVRLFEDDDLLARVRGLIADNMLDLPVVCRTDRGALELAVAAMRNGAKHVLAADDFDVQ